MTGNELATPAELRGVTLFGGLDSAALERVAAVTKIYSRPARSILTIGTDLPDNVICVLEGACGLSAISPNGIFVTLLPLYEGDACGVGQLLAGYRHQAPKIIRLVVARDCRLGCIPFDDFLVLLEALPGLPLACAKLQARMYVEIAQRYIEMGILDVRGRLVGEILRLSQRGVREGDRVVVLSAPTHAEIAAQLGSGRETVSRILADLAKEGLVSSRRGEIVIERYKDLLAEYEAQAGRAFFLLKS